ncbi:MAG: hypothetical protein ACQEQ4_03635 [Fibrobacterota bacterium]
MIHTKNGTPKAIGLLIGFILLFSCSDTTGPDDDQNNDDIQTYSGSWSGSMAGDAVAGSWEFDIDFSDSSITGIFTGDIEGDIAGDLTSSGIVAEGTGSEAVFEWSGTFSEDKNDASGDWTVQGDISGSGTWSTDDDDDGDDGDDKNRQVLMEKNWRPIMDITGTDTVHIDEYRLLMGFSQNHVLFHRLVNNEYTLHEVPYDEITNSSVAGNSIDVDYSFRADTLIFEITTIDDLRTPEIIVFVPYEGTIPPDDWTDDDDDGGDDTGNRDIVINSSWELFRHIVNWEEKTDSGVDSGSDTTHYDDGTIIHEFSEEDSGTDRISNSEFYGSEWSEDSQWTQDGVSWEMQKNTTYTIHSDTLKLYQDVHITSSFEGSVVMESTNTSVRFYQKHEQ